jgi:hypothetical protein
MLNILDVTPDAEAYAFTYRFQLGHELRPPGMSQLRIECERYFEEARVFLDTAGLVDGIEEEAEPLDASEPFGAQDLTSGEIRPLPVVEWRTSEEHRGLHGSVSGLTVSIPAGTQFGVSRSPADREGPEISIRFPRDTDVEIGARSAGGLARHRVRGLRPVLLNGMPLLAVAANATCIDVRMRESRTAIFNLLVVVSPYRRRGDSALYHVMEAAGDRIIGGTSLQFRV